MQNSRVWITHVVSPIALYCVCHCVAADLTISPSEGTEISLGGRIVVQHYDIEEETTDETTQESDTEIRRLRPDIRAKWRDWRAKVAWELSDRNPNSIKDAYIEYRGFENISLKFGNETAPFSRERMTSSRAQQLPERSLLGDNNWGTPGRIMGQHIEFEPNDRFTVYGALGLSDVYSDGYSEVRFLSPVRKDDIKDEQRNSGQIIVGRVDTHIINAVPYKQSQLKEKLAITASVAGYYWMGDEDAPTSNDFYETVSGYELALAARFDRFSIDTQFQKISASLNGAKFSDEIKTFLESDNPLITNEIVRNNNAELSHANIDFGFMLLPKQLEVALGAGLLESGSTGKESTFANGDVWQHDWSYQELGLTYFIDGHNHKMTTSIKKDKHPQGKNETVTTLIAQWQFVF